MTQRGVVAGGDPQTARAGALVLRQGGNAIDAVCASAFASFVAEPPLTSPGGAGVLLHGGPDRDWAVADFFARVPGLAGGASTLDFFPVTVDFGVTTQDFHVGKGAAAVPGALRGLVQVHLQHGRLPLADVVAPAWALANDGCVVSAGIAQVIDLLEPIMTLTGPARDLVCVDGRLAVAGTRLTSPGQAHLFECLGRDPDETLRAFEADLASEFGPSQGGLLSAADLDTFRPVTRAPLATPFGRHTVLANPPPSAGGALIALGLRIAERAGFFTERFGRHHAALARVLGAVSHARADDYDAKLNQPQFIESLLSDVGVDRVGQQWSRAVAERSLGGTTHISVLDGEGGAASLTMTNGEGSGHALPSWGTHINNFLGEEDINPLGFHRLPAGTQMTTMMAPTVILENGRPVLVLGSGGSNRLRSAILQALLFYLGFEARLGDAIEADRLHVEGAKLWFEATRMSDAHANELLRAWPGATRFDEQSLFFGGVHAVAASDGRLSGIGDRRRDGAVCTAEEV